MSDNRKAILVVSFGTSYAETRKKTIDRIEEEIRKACPDRRVYRSWTSGKVLKKLKLRDGIHYDNICEALDRMLEDGVREITVQPTYVMNGIEYESMISDVLDYRNKFDRIACGQPLLASAQDSKDTVDALMKEFGGLERDEALVLMGHGTRHHANRVYAELEHTFQEQNYDNVFVGTVEGEPRLSDVIGQVKKGDFRKIHLAPLLFVAGEHALNDMAGEKDSWKTRFESEGYFVECHLKGLGQYEGIRRIILRHLREANLF